jgi:hypothetical protein
VGLEGGWCVSTVPSASDPSARDNNVNRVLQGHYTTLRSHVGWKPGMGREVLDGISQTQSTPSPAAAITPQQRNSRVRFWQSLRKAHNPDVHIVERDLVDGATD